MEEETAPHKTVLRRFLPATLYVHDHVFTYLSADRKHRAFSFLVQPATEADLGFRLGGSHLSTDYKILSCRFVRFRRYVNTHLSNVPSKVPLM